MQEFWDGLRRATRYPKAQLLLQLEDFVDLSHVSVKVNAPIVISTEALCSIVDKAQKRATDLANNNTIAYSLPFGVSKNDREDTPPEEIRR